MLAVNSFNSNNNDHIHFYFLLRIFFFHHLYTKLLSCLKLRVFATVVVVVCCCAKSSIQVLFASSWLTFLFCWSNLLFKRWLAKKSFVDLFPSKTCKIDLRVDCDDFATSTSNHQDSLKSFRQYLQELHVWNVNDKKNEWGAVYLLIANFFDT